MKNFTKGYKVYNQLQKIQKTGDKKFYRKCVNAIMEYREANTNTTKFDFNKVLRMLNANDLNGLYNYCNNWLAENDDRYDGENWYGETYQ